MEFADLAKHFRRDAEIAELMAEHERKILDRLEYTRPSAILFSETTIAEMYDAPDKCLLWFHGAHREWLKRNSELMSKVEHQTFYRLIFIPYPSILGNLPARKALIELIIFHVHFQLWHGIVVGAVFVDPRKPDIMSMLKKLNFISMPQNSLFLDYPDFYQSEHASGNIIKDTKAFQAHQKKSDILRGLRLEPIWLHYDERNYSKIRLSGWRWQSLRKFCSLLYGPKIKCAYCGNIAEPFSLDHIAPISEEYYQTINNFRPLCKICNSQKGAKIGKNPYVMSMILPDYIYTKDLDYILMHRPSWLGEISYLKNRSSIRKELLFNVLG